jgi:hypothetical protein
MADNEEDTQQTGATGGAGRDASEKTPPAANPLDAPKPRVRLAHHPTLRVAVPDTDRTEPALREPVTTENVVNIYGLPPIYFHTADAQARGFTPYFVARRGGKPTADRYDDAKRNAGLPEGEVRAPLNLFPVTLAAAEEGETGESVEIDIDSADEAVRVVLTQFTGIYKPVEEKGA